MVASSYRIQTSITVISGGASEIGKAVAEKLYATGRTYTNFFQNTISGLNTVESVGHGASSADEVADTELFALHRTQHVSLNHLTVRPSLQPF